MKTIKLLLSLFALLAITACSSDDEPDIVEPHDPAFTFRFSDNGTLTVNGATPILNEEFNTMVDNHAWRIVSWNMIKQNGNIGVIDSKEVGFQETVFYFDKGVGTLLRDCNGELSHDVFGIQYREETGEITTPSGCFGQEVVFRILKMTPEGERLLTILPSRNLIGYGEGHLLYSYVILQRLSDKELQDLLEKHDLQIID